MPGKRQLADDAEQRDDSTLATQLPPPAKRADGHQKVILVSDYASLPLSLLQHVWDYALDLDMSDGVCPTANHPLFLFHTYAVRRVCRSWDSAVQQTLDERLRHAVVLDVAAHAKRHLPSSLSRIVLRPTRSPRYHHTQTASRATAATTVITDVRISMGNIVSSMSFRDQVGWMDNEQPLLTVRVQRDEVLSRHVPEIDWEATLAPWAATVVRLDLSRMLLYTKQLGEVLHVAARMCPNVKELLLPGLEKRFYKDELARMANMYALSSAMKAWYTSNGGLRHLHVPFVGKQMKMAERFLNDVTAYCPDIEYLDGYTLTFMEQNQLELVTCELLLHVPPSVWHAFWTTCTKLRSWNTVVLPFAFDYYQAIADSPPMEHMTELVISHNSAMVCADAGMEDDFMHHIMSKFPRLRKLRVVFGDERHSWHSSIRQSFGDRFLKSLVRYCPELEEVSLRSRAGTFQHGDKSFRSLLKLVNLKVLTVEGGYSLCEDAVSNLVERAILEKRHMKLRFAATEAGRATREVLGLIKTTRRALLDGVSLTVRIQSEELNGHFVWSSNYGYGSSSGMWEMVTAFHKHSVRVHLHVSKRDVDETFYNDATVDSMVLSINDHANFHCTREHTVMIGNQAIHDELCGDCVRASDVFIRDFNVAKAQFAAAKLHNQGRTRLLHVSGVMESDDEGDLAEDVELPTRVEVGVINDDDEFDDEAGMCVIQ